MRESGRSPAASNGFALPRLVIDVARKMANHCLLGLRGGRQAGVEVLLLEEVVEGATWVVRTP
jgi:hypothetical protein